MVAAPCYTRPESDQWFCSLRLGVLEGDVKSRSLKKAFGWDRPVPGLVLAVQLVSLSMKFEVRATGGFFFDLACFLPYLLRFFFRSVTTPGLPPCVPCTASWFRTKHRFYFRSSVFSWVEKKVHPAGRGTWWFDVIAGILMFFQFVTTGTGERLRDTSTLSATSPRVAARLSYLIKTSYGTTS